MTKKYRTKKCKCGKNINETTRHSEDQWQRVKYCSKGCKTSIPISLSSNIVKLYAVDELSLEKIGELYGVSRTAIKTVLKKYDIPDNDKSTFIKVEHRSGIVDLYRKTGSSYKVEEKYPYSRKAIDKYLKSVGVQHPRKMKRNTNLIPDHVKNGIVASAMSNEITKKISAWR